jgi:superfamily II DNA or RNA helicase
VQQWKSEIEKFGINSVLVVGESSNPAWKDKFADTLIDLTIGYISSAIVLVTFATFAKDYFIDIIKKHKGEKIKTLLIADEVHGLGAKKLRNALKDDYDYRLGLSATPKRWFDDSGTRFLYDYFNDVIFEFTLKDAINNINPVTNKSFLTPYRYIPHFITLTDDEREEYVELSQKIWFKLNSLKEQEQEDDIVLKGLMNKRANIKKNAYKKYSVLEKLIDDLMPDIKWCIIYCTPQQIEHVMRILNKKNVIAHRFTMGESTVPSNKYGGISEREFILKKFAEGEYQILVAMKCLDEGVDIPPARTAILLASSGNPREYIQRIGRVIRRFPDKEEATIHDIIVIPEIGYMPKVVRKIEWNMFLKEIDRYEQIAESAINNVEVLDSIYRIKSKFRGVL